MNTHTVAGRLVSGSLPTASAPSLSRSCREFARYDAGNLSLLPDCLFSPPVVSLVFWRGGESEGLPLTAD